MKNVITNVIAAGLTAIALILSVGIAHAKIRSKSKEVVVLEPRDLPEQAQVKGDALLLHTDSNGSTLLYIEQLGGTCLSVLDVTDPSHIKLVTSVQLSQSEPFDFVRSFGDQAELVYFRKEQKLGVLDLYHPTKPSLRSIDASTDLATAEWLGGSTLLASGRPYNGVPTTTRDYQVIDDNPLGPKSLLTVKNVKQRVTNSETGTIFLLGSEGLTVVRRLSAETDCKIHEMQMEGN